MPPIAILVALADPTRCRLIDLLQAGPQPVHLLAAAFRISRPAISRHLRVLKQAGLISENKLGRENRYSLHPRKLAPVQRWLDGLLPPAKGAETAPVAPETAAAARPKRAPKPARAPRAPSPAVASTSDDVGLAAAKKPPAVTQMGFDF